MGLFNRRAVPTIGKDLNPSERARARALWRLTALPREEFDATYGEMLARYRRCVAAGRGPAWAAVWDQAMACATAALKVRQARIVPRFAPAEDAARLAEAMSFALAACVFAERFAPVLGRARAPGWSALTGNAPSAAALDDVPVPDCFGAMLLARLTGNRGLDWLGQQTEALRAAVAYFAPGPSELREIADEGASRIGEPVGRAQPVEDAHAAAETGGAGRVPERKAPSAEPVSEAGPATGGQDGESESGTPAPSAAAPDPAPAGADTHPAPVAASADAAPEARERRNGPPAIGGVGRGWEWVNWVRRELSEGGIAANAADGWLHNVGGEGFVIVPDGYAAFAGTRPEDAKTVRNRVTKLGKHRRHAWRGGMSDEFVAHLEDGRRPKGMVFPGELFWDESPPPMSKSVLDRRSR